MYRSALTRTLALAGALLAVLAPEARAQEFRVVVVPGLRLADLEALERRGAVGLLVPGAGPETSEAQARAALVRGKVRNSLLGGAPAGPALITIETASAPPASGPAIVLALPLGGPQPNDRRYPIAVLGQGYEGILTSDSTRIPGIVSIADVAPTALGREQSLGSRPEGDAPAALAELDRRISENGKSRAPTSLLAAALVAALALVLPRAAVLGVAAGLVANLVLGAAGISGLPVVLLVVGLAVAAGAPLLALAARSPLALGCVLAAVIAGYLAAMALDPASVALSPFGPTQNARFYGVSNLLETMLLVPALMGAALLSERFGPLGFAFVAAVALTTIAGSRFGADGGGAAVLAVGYAVLAVQLARFRTRKEHPAAHPQRGHHLAALGGAVALVLLLVALDAATGPSSHVTRALEGGPEGLARDLGRRLTISFERAVADWYVALIVAAAALALVVLVVRTLRRSLPRRRRALLLAFAAAVGASLLVNDSPADVTMAGLVSYVALERYPLD